MANTFSFNAGQSNYTGEVLDDILTYTLQENETYKEGLIHVKPGIQKKYALPHVQIGKIIQDHRATPDSSVGNYIFAERYLEPKDFMIYFEFNPRDFEQYYKPFQPHGNLVFRELNPKIQAIMVRELLGSKCEYLNEAIWCSALADSKAHLSGSNAGDIGGEAEAGPLKYFDGAIMRMLTNINAAATTEDAKCGQVITAGTGTFENGEAVETELYAMWHIIPPKLRKKQGCVFLMDYKTWDAYNKYLSSKTFKHTDNRSEDERRFLGKRIIPMVALPNDTIIYGAFTSGVDSNLWMGVDYINDEEVLYIDKLQNNSELYFFKMLLKMDVNIVRPKEIVAHLPFTYTA